MITLIDSSDTGSEASPERKSSTHSPLKIKRGYRSSATSTVDEIRVKAISDIKKSLKASFSRGNSSSGGILNDHSEDDIYNTTIPSPKKFSLFSEKYTDIETIGQGSSAVVKKIMRKSDQQVLVGKSVRTRDSELLEFVHREYQILSKVDHPNIVKAYEMLTNDTKGTVTIVMDYIEGKTLSEIIMEKGRIEEQKLKKYIHQLLSALLHIHKLGVCHRDLTCSNILIDQNDDLKLIDFSVSAIYNKCLWDGDNKCTTIRKHSNFEPKTHKGHMFTNTGTQDYKSPEMIAGAAYDQNVDMWSLGVIMYYALCGLKPFRAKYTDKLYKRILEAKVKWTQANYEAISNEAKLFIQACLTKNSFIRICPKEALYHPWIKNFKLSLETVDSLHALNSFHSPSPRNNFKKSTTMDPTNDPQRRNTAPLSVLKEIIGNKQVSQERVN